MRVRIKELETQFANADWEFHELKQQHRFSTNVEKAKLSMIHERKSILTDLISDETVKPKAHGEWDNQNMIVTRIS